MGISMIAFRAVVSKIGMLFSMKFFAELSLLRGRLFLEAFFGGFLFYPGKTTVKFR